MQTYYEYYPAKKFLSHFNAWYEGREDFQSFTIFHIFWPLPQKKIKENRNKTPVKYFVAPCPPPKKKNKFLKFFIPLPPIPQPWLDEI